MNTVYVSLHTHTSDGSPDAAWSEAESAAYYHDVGMVTAVADHDVWTIPSRGRLRAVEHTIDRKMNLHVVELADGFTFLAHPSHPFPENTREMAERYVRENGLDGVEKYNGGVKQYDGTIPGVVELANDDAHNAFQAASSFMEVRVDGSNTDAIMDSIRAGDFTIYTEDGSPWRIAGLVSKATCMVLNRATPGGSR